MTSKRSTKPLRWKCRPTSPPRTPPKTGGGTENLASLNDAVPASGDVQVVYQGSITHGTIYSYLAGKWGSRDYKLNSSGDDGIGVENSDKNFSPASTRTCTYKVFGKHTYVWLIDVWEEEGTVTLVETPSVINTDDIKDGFTYDGSSHKWEPILRTWKDTDLAKDTNYSVTYKRNGEVTDDFISAGTIDVHIEAYNGFTGTFDYQYTISKAKVTAKVAGTSDTCTYDGQSHDISGFKVTDVIDEKGVHTDVYKTSNVQLKSGQEAKATGTDAKTYRMGLTSDSFQSVDTDNFDVTFEVTDGVLTINKAKIIAKVAGTSDTCTYDGDGHYIDGFTVTDVTNQWEQHTDISKLYKTENVVLATGKKAHAEGGYKGTYPMGLDESYFQNNDSNFEVDFDVTDGVLTINPAQVTVYVAGTTATKPYNGSEQEITGYKQTDITGDATAGYSAEVDAKLKTEGSDVAAGTAVGEYKMALNDDSFENTNSNYEVTFKVTNGALTISPADTMTVSCDGYKGVYDGESHSATATAYVPDGTDATIEYSLDGEKWTSEAPSIKDAGEKTVYVRATNSNYVTAESSYTLKVSPAQVTVSVEGNSKTTIYNGSEQSVEGYTAAIVEGSQLYDTKKVVLKEGVEAKASGKDATLRQDPYQMSLTSDSFDYADPNFDVTLKVTDGSLTIDPAEVTVSVAGKTDTLVYNGQEQALEGFVMTGVEGESSDVYSPNSIELEEGAAVTKGTNVGTYKMVLEADSFTNKDDNFVVTFKAADGTLTIAKRAIEVADSATFEYNGQEQVLNIDAAKVSGLVDGDRLYLNNAQVKGTEPGTYTDVTEYSWDVVNNKDNVTANYDLKVSGELAITAADGSGSAADNGNGSAAKADGSSAAKTGDATAPFAAGAGIVAVAAALAAFLVSRKLRGARQ